MFCVNHTCPPDPTEDGPLSSVPTDGGLVHLRLHFTALQRCPQQWESANHDSDPSSAFSVFLSTL